MNTDIHANAAARYKLLGQTLDAWGMVKANSRPPKRVLVIDDELPTAESLAFALQYEGYDAAFECNVIDGIAAANRWLPDVIILDMNMPERDGFDTASIIRRIIPNPDLVIIAYTGEYHPDIEQKAYRSGFDGYCRKGGALEPLLSTIAALSV